MKNKKINLICIILFAILSIIIFLIPNKSEFTSSFTISYVFFILNFLYILYLINYSKNSIKNLFFNYSHYIVACISILITFILAIMTKFVLINIPLLIIIELLVLFFEIIYISRIKLNENIVEKNELTREKNTEALKNWLTDVEIINLKNNNDNIKLLLAKIKGSDPVSNEKTRDIDNQITNMIKELKSGKSNNINEIIAIIDERNIILKNSK